MKQMQYVQCKLDEKNLGYGPPTMRLWALAAECGGRWKRWSTHKWIQCTYSGAQCQKRHN